MLTFVGLQRLEGRGEHVGSALLAALGAQLAVGLGEVDQKARIGHLILALTTRKAGTDMKFSKNVLN